MNPGLQKLREAGAGDAALQAFNHYYERLRQGEVGELSESELEPVGELDALEELPPGDDAAAAEALDRAVVLKLNGGLGTSMGLRRPKSLLEVKDGLTFLDIIARQVLELRARFEARLPLVLMNSFHTRDESLAALQRYPDLAVDVPLDFVQNRFPKLRAETLEPVGWPQDPELEWAPPGHGDIYTALQTSGMLEALLERGYRYAFVSNSDNLGAVPQTRILTWLAREEIPFVMEVAHRTEADRKGGHVALRRGGGLVLRERAQTPDADIGAFEDVQRHRFFNTNNLWVDLHALAEELDRRGGVLELPLMVNRKTVDPADPSSPAVIQLETAMGGAIGVFEGSRALVVPRTRFAPVKTTNDLLAVRSDAYLLSDDSRVELLPERGERPPLVDLDSRFFKILRDFEARFPTGPPSLRACERLKVIGDVVFGRGVLVRGEVLIENAGEGQLQLEDDSLLEGP